MQIFKIFCALFFASALFGAGQEKNDSLSSFDFHNFEDSIKNVLVDSPRKADSLAQVIIEISSDDYPDSVAAIGWFYRAEASYYLGRFDRACDFYEQSDELLDSARHPSRKAILLNNLGLTHFYKERYNDALEAFIRSAELEKALDHDYGFAQSLHNIALIYEESGQPQKAETYFNYSLDMFLKMDSLRDAAGVYNDYGIFLSAQQKHDEALQMYGEALDLYELHNNRMEEAKVKCNIGALHLYQENYAESSRFLEAALDYFKETDNKDRLINVYSLLGDLYYQQDRTALAVGFYDRAETIALNKGWNRMRQKNLYSLYKALKAGNEHGEALAALEKYTQLKDSLIRVNDAYVASSIDDELENDLKEKELQLSRARIKENILFLVIGVLLLIIGVAVGWFFRRKEFLKNRKEKKFLQEKVSRMQMNPHFIFNAMASVQNYIIAKEKDEALDFLSDIAQLLRQLLEVSEKELISLDEEQDLLDKYLKVQCRRYFQSDNCKVHTRVISGSRMLLLPPLLMRPVVDAIFSGKKARECQCSEITITYEQKNHVLEIVLESEGVLLGRDLLSSERLIIEQRIGSMRKKTKEKHLGTEIVELYEEGSPKGVRIVVRLPLIKNRKN